jgi:zinc protease
MPRTLRLSPCVLLLATLASCAAVTHRGDRFASDGHDLAIPARPLHSLLLASGIRLVVEEDRSSPVVAVVNVVAAGSTHDPPGKEGLAHLVEHLTFRAKVAGTVSLWTRLAEAGAADVGATTDFDATVFHAVGPRAALAELVTLEGSRATDPLADLDEATFATEREVVRNELRLRGETHAAGAVLAAIQGVTFPPDHAYARPVIGTHESLSSITLEDARAFVRERYRPSRMTVVIAGDVDVGSVRALLASRGSASFGGPVATTTEAIREPPGAIHAETPPEPPPARPLLAIEAQVASPELFVAWSLPRAYADGDPLGELAAERVRRVVWEASNADRDIMGGTAFLVQGEQASLLVAEIVLRDGSHPDASSRRVLGGLFHAWETGDGETPRQADVRFAQRTARMLTAEMSDAEELGRRAEASGRFARLAADRGAPPRALQALATITREAAEDFARRYVNGERARLVLVRPLPPDATPVEGRSGFDRPIDAPSARLVRSFPSMATIAIPPGLGRAFIAEPMANGLVAMAARHGTMPIATIGLGFRAGSAEERVPGAAALADALARSGFPTSGRFDDFGAILTRAIEPDEIFFRVAVQRRFLGEVLKVLADHVASLRVRGGTSQGFRTNTLPYLRAALGTPEAVGQRAFAAALLGDHPYARVGTLESALPGESEANEWLASALDPQRAVLAIVGDVEPSAAMGAARDAFAGWARGADRPPPAPPPAPEAGRAASLVTARPGSTQADLQIGCRLAPATASDATRNAVMAATLRQRLEDALRERMGATYGFVAWSTVYRGGTAFLTVRGTVENGALAAALRVVRAEMAGANRLTDADFGAGLWSVARAYNLGLDTSSEWVESVVDSAVLGWPFSAGDSTPQVLASFSAADRVRLTGSLQRCAREGVVSVVGDPVLARRALAEAWPAP